MFNNLQSRVGNPSRVAGVNGSSYMEQSIRKHNSYLKQEFLGPASVQQIERLSLKLSCGSPSLHTLHSRCTYSLQFVKQRVSFLSANYSAAFVAAILTRRMMHAVCA